MDKRGTRLRSAFVILGLTLGACNHGARLPVAIVTDSPSPKQHDATDTGHSAPFERLVSPSARVGSFRWRCSNKGRAIIELVLPHPGATDYVSVYEGKQLVLHRKLQPGQSVRLPLPNSSDQRWHIRQAEEPRTLTVTVLIKPKPVRGCLVYLPPTVHLRSKSHSH